MDLHITNGTRGSSRKYGRMRAERSRKLESSGRLLLLRLRFSNSSSLRRRILRSVRSESIIYSWEKRASQCEVSNDETFFRRIFEVNSKSPLLLSNRSQRRTAFIGISTLIEIFSSSRIMLEDLPSISLIRRRISDLFP